MNYIRNMPFQDEFATVLDFLLRYRETKTWHAFATLLFNQENEHRIVTSRLIFLALKGLTGKINFSAVAVLGDGFIVAAIAVIAWQEREVAYRLVLIAVLSLLIFQMQHFENLFLSFCWEPSASPYLTAGRLGASRAGLFSLLWRVLPWRMAWRFFRPVHCC